MKILYITLAAIAGLIIIVVLIGSMLPKKHRASRSATFHATPERLYALIAGPQNWRPDVTKEESVAGPQGREMRNETTRNGETITYELLDRVPPHSLTRRIATPNLPYSGAWTFTLEPQGSTTVVRITEDGEVYNPIFRFVSRFIIGHTSTIDAYLKALEKATIAPS